MEAHEVLQKVKSGEISVEEAEQFFRREPFEEMGYAKIDSMSAVSRSVQREPQIFP